MMAVPGKTDSGVRTSQLVEFVDIFPTIAEAAGLPTLDTCPDPSNSSQVCTGQYHNRKLQNPHEHNLCSFKIPDGPLRIPHDPSNISTEGSSLMPLMEDPESSDWKKAVFWQYPRLAKLMR